MGVWSVLMLGPRVAVASGPGVLIWVTESGEQPQVEVAGLPRLGATDALGVLGLAPRAAPTDAAPFLAAMDAVRGCYESGSHLDACLTALDAALEHVPTVVRPGDLGRVCQHLAFAAQVYLAGGRSGRAEAAIEALRLLAPAIALDVAQTPPEVASMLETRRGTGRRSLSLDASPDLAGCEVLVGSEAHRPPVSLPLAVARASVRCADGRESFVHDVASPMRVAPWEFGVVVSGDALLAARESDARLLTTALLSATAPLSAAGPLTRPAVPAWVAVVTCGPDICTASLRRRAGEGVLLRSAPAQLASTLLEALEPQPPLVALAPLAPIARVRPWWHWTLLGVGGAAILGGGVAHGLAARTITEDINHGVDAMDTLERERVAYVTLYSLGGAFVLTSAILLIIGEEPVSP